MVADVRTDVCIVGAGFAGLAAAAGSSEVTLAVRDRTSRDVTR